MKWFSGACWAFCAVCTAPSLLQPNRNLSLSLRGGGGAAGKSVTSLVYRLGIFLRSKPIIRNSLACMCLSAIGDILAQRFELLQNAKARKARHNAIKTTNNANDQELELLNLNRTLTLASFGLIVAGPLYSMWYPFLEGLCHPWSLSKYGLWATPIAKMMIEMTFLEPLFLSLFFGYMTLAEGGTVEMYQHKMASEFLPTYKTSLAVWPPYMLVSFRFVPVAAQTIAMNLAMAFWDAFLSYQNARTMMLLSLMEETIEDSTRSKTLSPSALLQEISVTTNTSTHSYLRPNVQEDKPTFDRMGVPTSRLGQPTTKNNDVQNSSIQEDERITDDDDKDDEWNSQDEENEVYATD